MSPKPNPGRKMFAEDHVGEWVRLKRTERGMTYESLAKRMEEVGCPIQPSGIYKLERQEGRRRITVDELVAFSQIFDVPIADLTTDPELHLTERAVAILAEMTRVLEQADALVAQADQVRGRIRDLDDTLVPLIADNEAARAAYNEWWTDRLVGASNYLDREYLERQDHYQSALEHFSEPLLPGETSAQKALRQLAESRKQLDELWAKYRDEVANKKNGSRQ